MRLAQKDRIRDQELERQEKMRLEEILAMCAEYERQSSRAAVEKPQRQQQNRYVFCGRGGISSAVASARTMDSPAASRNDSFFFDYEREDTEYTRICIGRGVNSGFRSDGNSRCFETLVLA